MFCIAIEGSEWISALPAACLAKQKDPYLLPYFLSPNKRREQRRKRKVLMARMTGKITRIHWIQHKTNRVGLRCLFLNYKSIVEKRTTLFSVFQIPGDNCEAITQIASIESSSREFVLDHREVPSGEEKAKPAVENEKLYISTQCPARRISK